MSWRSSRYPFTSAQWQELEHQSLIFKYLASGIPIPSDLILPLRRSFVLDSTPSTTPSLAFPPQPSLGWGWQQLGYGGRGKAEDPEPGRCRRTDGKKWRCSKEAYPDSKYCEKHMHRGKNRSRKPVEMSLSSTTTSSKSSTHYPPPPLSISTTLETPSHHLFYSRPPGIAFHPPNSCLLDKDYHRYCPGGKDVDECSFLSEASAGSERENCLPFRPLGERKHSPAEVGLVKEQQHCFVLGADFKQEKPVKEEEREERQRPLRHFFEEWPQKRKGSLLGLEEEEHSSSKTQLWLSISKWFSSLISHPMDLTSFLPLISLSFFFFILSASV